MITIVTVNNTTFATWISGDVIYLCLLNCCFLTVYSLLIIMYAVLLDHRTAESSYMEFPKGYFVALYNRDASVQRKVTSLHLDKFSPVLVVRTVL